MNIRLVAPVLAAALLSCQGVEMASAQNAGGEAPTTTQPATPPAPPPPATTAPPAAGTNAPSGQQLPEVQIIQQQPKPQPKPVKATKPKAKPATAVTAGPPATPPTGTPEPGQAAGEQYAQPVGPEVVKMSPLGGSEIPIDKVPGSVSTVSSADISRQKQSITPETLQQRVPGIVLDDYQGNQFQQNVQYRGFETSPVNGVAQGLAVYQNGVRINEAFGDIVNWDFLPSKAINDIAVMSSNPVFGLNALGGSISVTMKDGFNFQGADIDTRFGSFGRKQVGAEAGASSHGMSVYGAFEGIDDDGFRDFSESEIRRGYADIGVRNENAEFHFNFTGAENFVGATAAAPEQLLNINRSLTYTSPQTTDNELQMYSINGTVRATNDITLSGVTYYRHFKQAHEDANIFDNAQDCADATPPGPSGKLCAGNDQVFDNANGNSVNFDPAAVYGSIDATSQDARSEGIALQAADKAKVFDHPNQFLVGVSYDHGKVGYTAQSELGTFGPKFVATGTGIVLSGSDDFNPRDLTTTNDYFGVYFSDTLDVTDRLSATVGGRWNYARIQIQDNTGDDDFLNGVNKYTRFNPNAGLTYKLAPWINWYGGYSEANRAPTAAELACADPENPCLIESFLTSDPHLDQVVSHTWETGFRGTVTKWTGERWNWSAGLFRTLNTDDIFSAASTATGRGFFQNVGDTLRQGVEATLSYRSKQLFWYMSYNYTDATFDSDIPFFPSPNHPDSSSPDLVPCPPDPADPTVDTGTCQHVRKGDTIPGIPKHRFKAGIDYWMTPKWMIGGDLLAASSQFFFGDEANLSRTLGGYTRVNLHTSYDLTEHVQVYGLIENLFDRQYASYGTYFSVDDANDLTPVTGVTFSEDNNRSVTPAIPFAAYGGVRVKF